MPEKVREQGKGKPQALPKRTYIYKVVDGCEIGADVYPAGGHEPAPTLVWIHGGALIGGHRENIRPEQAELYHGSGFALISIDYRLAPETKLPAIVEDIMDAFCWVRKRGARLARGDPSRIGVIGHSAGGYLALMAGFRVVPRPKALVSFYGYGDIASPWYSRPDPFYSQRPVVSREEALRSVGTKPVSNDQGSANRFLFYRYCRQRGLWPREVAGLDPDAEFDAFDPLCPLRNVTRRYPPTMLLHGDADTDVPYQRSLEMADALRRAGVEHELIVMPGRGHGFDGVGLRDPDVAGAFDRVVGFLRRHLT